MIFAILGLNVIAWRRFFKKGNSESTASAEKVLLMTLFSKMAIKSKIRSGVERIFFLIQSIQKLFNISLVVFGLCQN